MIDGCGFEIQLQLRRRGTRAVSVHGSGAGLIKASVLKPVIATIEQGLVLRILGHLSAAYIKTLREVVADIIG